MFNLTVLLNTLETLLEVGPELTAPTPTLGQVVLETPTVTYVQGPIGWVSIV